MPMPMNDVVVTVEHITAMLSALGAMIASIGALLVAIRNASRIQEIHLSLNSRLTELLRTTALASHAEGAQSERDKAAK